MERTPFLLSHHSPADYHRCVRVGGWHVCARCLGLYPVLFAALAAQIALRAPLSHSWDSLIAFALPLPGLIDWARGRLWPLSGSNAGRLITGVLLGLSLARTLYLHLRAPWNPTTTAQMAGFLLIAAAVELVAWRRRASTRKDPSVPLGVEELHDAQTPESEGGSR